MAMGHCWDMVGRDSAEVAGLTTEILRQISDRHTSGTLALNVLQGANPRHPTRAGLFDAETAGKAARLRLLRDEALF